MFDSFRYWLSAGLLDLAIKVLPDEYTKVMLRYGITVAANQMEDDIEEVNQVEGE